MRCFKEVEKDTYKKASFARLDMLAEISPVNPLDDKSLIRIGPLI